MDEIPEISKNLIDKLEELIPERCPSITMSEREIWFYAGKRDLVRQLKQIFDESTESLSENYSTQLVLENVTDTDLEDFDTESESGSESDTESDTESEISISSVSSNSEKEVRRKRK